MGKPNYEDSVAGNAPEDNLDTGSDSSLGYLQHSADQGTTIGLLIEGARDDIDTPNGPQTEAADGEA